LSTSWLKIKHDKELLTNIFRAIDTNGDGWISYKEHIAFIRKFFGGRLSIEDFVDPFQGINEAEEEQLYGGVWSELRQIYARYTKGAFLNAEELEKLVREVLHEYKQTDMEYIFWNMFRVDPNSDRKIEFEEFAPFILKHAGEIGLRNFHSEQVLGKNTLDQDEFYIVFKNGFNFLKSTHHHHKILQHIFTRLAKGHTHISYGDYCGWVFASIANKVR
jgi:Ca2+-binding EF-hand superfamily protein